METWHALAVDSYAAANELFAKQRWRSAINRAYYAVYAKSTATLIDEGIEVGSRTKANPSHEAMRNLVLNNWDRSPVYRESVYWRLYELFMLRVTADYQPQYAVDDRDARVALGLMVNVFRMIKVRE